MNILDYYKHFVSISGALAGLVSGFPLISSLLPKDLSRYIFPPLGQVEIPARISAVLLSLAVTYVVYFYRDASFVGSKSGRRKVLVGSVLLGLAFVCVYLVLNLTFVRERDIPTEKSSVLVSIGYKRTEAAKATFGNASDEEMLRRRGTEEEEIRGLWTLRSIAVVRISMFLSYACSFLSLVAIFSLGVLFDFCGIASSP
jgi:hypothetical protein